MSTKRTLIAIAVTFVATMIVGGVVHGGLLAGDYAALPDLMRTPEDAERHFLWMLLGHVVMSVAFVLVYQRGRDQRPWLGQGIRFGLLIALASSVPLYLIYHAVMPFPIALVFKQVLFDTLSLILVGIVIAWLHR
jgi:hypothetical protein